MNLVQVLPKGRFGEMISFEFHPKNRHEKTQKPLWFLGFQPRYLFRCYLLVAGVGFEPHDLRVMSPTSYRTAPSRDVLTLRIIYHIEQSVKHFFALALQVSRLFSMKRILHKYYNYFTLQGRVLFDIKVFYGRITMLNLIIKTHFLFYGE